MISDTRIAPKCEPGFNLQIMFLISAGNILNIYLCMCNCRYYLYSVEGKSDIALTNPI